MSQKSPRERLPAIARQSDGWSLREALRIFVVNTSEKESHPLSLTTIAVLIGNPTSLA